MTFLENTGQSGAGLIAFFEKFRAQEVLSQARRYPYFRSHPLSSNRIDALRERVDESPYTNVVDSPEDRHDHKMMKAKHRGLVLQSLENSARLMKETDLKESLEKPSEGLKLTFLPTYP